VKSGIFVLSYSNKVSLIRSESNTVFRASQITSGCVLCWARFTTNIMITVSTCTMRLA